MNPSDANSPLSTLRQLKELLDAGTLTPTEFEALKQQLIFGKEGVGPLEAPLPLMPLVPAAAAPAADLLLPTDFLEPEPEPKLPAAETSPPTPPAAANWAAPAPLLSSEPPGAPVAGRRNPLTWVFAVGGALVLLAIVLYLALGNQPANEHLTSSSQTAADSTAVAPEVGPQAEQITLPPATVPETVRVAPASSPRVAPAAATRFRADSVATPAPAPAAPATPPPAADSAASQP